MPLMFTKKTKIVCTIGPATESSEMLEKLLKAGMNVMRLNFSHGDFNEHQARVDRLKALTAKTGIPAAIMQDLSGPKFRIGDFYKERVILKEGDFITLTPEKIVGDEKRVSINYPTLANELKVGNIVMVDDGKKKFEVVEIKNSEIKCKILVGGETKGRRSVNLPGAYLKISSLTAKDKKDIEFGIKNNVDIIAFSFVRRAEDVDELRAILKKAKSKAMILSKIETQEAVDNFDSILEKSDAIMVARGDMAVEIGAENVPLVQKMIIKKCNAVGKPVITATQMLESMIKSPVPTRAEVSDVANAILDGTDAVMLSEETTLGDFPIKAVELMGRIAVKVEGGYLHKQFLNGNGNDSAHHLTDSVGDSITSATVHIADRVKAKYLVSLTETGHSTRMIARYRPSQHIIVMTPNKDTFQKLVLSFGTHPVLIKRFNSFIGPLKAIREFCVKNKIAKKGDKVVIASGMPFGKVIETNMTVVETI